jgi:hypothetical protein
MLIIEQNRKITIIQPSGIVIDGMKEERQVLWLAPQAFRMPIRKPG